MLPAPETHGSVQEVHGSVQEVREDSEERVTPIHSEARIAPILVPLNHSYLEEEETLPEKKPSQRKSTVKEISFDNSLLGIASSFDFDVLKKEGFRFVFLFQLNTDLELDPVCWNKNNNSLKDFHIFFPGSGPCGFEYEGQDPQYCMDGIH